jgi:hypothetical protein
MSKATRKDEIKAILLSAEGARTAMEREEWGLVERKLTEVQGRTARLLHEIGEKSREVIMAPKPDQGDRG